VCFVSCVLYLVFCILYFCTFVLCTFVLLYMCMFVCMCVQMADLPTEQASVVMGLAISTLCQLGTADERTVAFVRSLWIGYFKNTVLERRGHMDSIFDLEARVRRLRARPSDRQTSGYITTGGHAPRRWLAMRAVHAGADPFDSNSDSNSDPSDEPVNTDIGAGTQSK
jgi:hypothetical protein